MNLNLTVDISKYIDSHVDRHYHTFQEDGADVVVLQTVHDFDRWKRSGRLLPYKPAVWDDIYAAFRDPDGAFFGAFICKHILPLQLCLTSLQDWIPCIIQALTGITVSAQFGDIIYNKHLIAENDVPDSFADFNEPKWRNRLTLTYPNDDDAVLYLFSLIINKYGWSWLESLAQQNVHWVRGTGTTATLLAATDSTYFFSFTSNLNGSNNIASKTPKDPHMLWPQTCAAFASTTRPESAKLFLSWLVSDEFQQVNAANGDYLIRKDMNSTSGLVWDDTTTDVTQFWKFMTDRKAVEWWRLQVESILGTAQGGSPLHDNI